VNLSNENRLLLACIDIGISDEKLARVNSLASLPIKWDKLFDAALSQGIVPVVYNCLKDIPDRARVPEDTMEKFKMAYHGNVARNMYLHSELERILSVFDEKGIEVILLKGAALSKTVYRDIGLRQMSDIDLLVRQDKLDRVKEIMSGLNYIVKGGDRSEAWYKENHFHLPPFIHKDKSVIVEIHWEVAQDTLGIDVNKWWERAKKTKLGEASALIPSPEDMILHLCVSLYHSNYHQAALRGFCDIIFTIRFHAEQMNWARFREAVSQSEIARPVYSLLHLVRKYFDDGQFLSWVKAEPVDLKFSAMIERILFSSEDVPYGLLMRSLAADTLWKRTKMIFAGPLFPSRKEMSKRYPVRPDSLWVYLYYVYRPVDLVVKYGRSFLKMLCFRGPE